MEAPLSDAMNAVIRELNLTQVVRSLVVKEGDPAVIAASLCTAMVAIEDIYQSRMRYHEERYVEMKRSTDEKLKETRAIVFDIRDQQKKRDAWLVGTVGVFLIGALVKVFAI